MSKIKTILMFLIFWGALSLSAQVTIGSAQTPNKGALLDLKEDNITNKGLGLPRVVILHESIPSGDNMASTIKDATGNWNKDTHVGLLVYHAGDYDICDPTSIRQGIYVWNGDKWEYLGEQEEQSKDVLVWLDERDREKYLYRKFGNAGYWMLENVRYLDTNIMQAGIGADQQEYQEKYYTYPNADPLHPERIPSTWSPDQGLLYSYSAATLGAQDGTAGANQGQNGSDEAQSENIQGICPAGWHIPTDREWNKLEKEIYSKPYLYSEYDISTAFDPLTWNANWETQTESRGSYAEEGHARAMLSPCFPVGTPSISTPAEGKSMQVIQGGFYASPLGASDAEEGIRGYGMGAIFWSSALDSAAELSAWTRSILYDDTRFVNRIAHPRSYLLSIRCRKND